MLKITRRSSDLVVLFTFPNGETQEYVAYEYISVGEFTEILSNVYDLMVEWDTCPDETTDYAFNIHILLTSMTFTQCASGCGTKVQDTDYCESCSIERYGCTKCKQLKPIEYSDGYGRYCFDCVHGK